MPKNKAIFITATDTGAGKTVTALVLGLLLQKKGWDVGVMQPVQCAGQDARFLKKALGTKDWLNAINPFYAPEPVSPHLAFRRAKIKFRWKKVKNGLKKLRAGHDIVLIEGAGGLMVPLTRRYYNADLIADLKVPVIVVSRLGLGAINHTLLTLQEARRRKLPVKGLIFCQTKPGAKGLPERSNPEEIEQLSGVKVLGIIPYLKSLDKAEVLRRCRHIKI